jgi:PAS domain S-box-containing protein
MTSPDAPPTGRPFGAPKTSSELLVEGIVDYAIFMLDTEGIVRSWNVGAERLKGWQAHEIIGRPFTLFYTPAAIASGWPQEELRRAQELGRLEDEGWRVRRDGSRFWANVVITALRDADGVLQGFGKVTRDLTERREQEEALRQSEERFRLLVEAVPDHAIFMLDVQGRIESWNSGAVTITGFAGSDVLGRHSAMFYTPAEVDAGRPALDLERALREGRFEADGWRVRHDGSTFWARSAITPMFDERGSLRGFAYVVRDMTERRRVEELEQSSRRMNEFLAMLAHELRNPLAPIRNAVGVMQMHPRLDAPLVQCRDIIDRHLRDLTRLVDDLLDVGRIANGKLLLKRERLDFRDVVQHSVEAVRSLVEERHQQLSIEMPPRRLEVDGDHTRLAQALQNLLSNASRYTDPGGAISVTVQAEGSMVVVRVADTGRGIPPEAIDRIFELFVQAHATRSPSDSGLGIGLRLARTLVELHGGTVTAASAGLGQGSTFTMKLPSAVDAGRTSPMRDTTAEDPDARRVLVVDDNRDSADSMVSLLELLGHQAVAAYDADGALEAAERTAPNLVLLDLNMPGTSGFVVLQRLRERGFDKGTRMAAMTGYGQHADRQSTLAAGFDDHLTKPVDIEQLRAALMAAAPLRND